MANPFLAIFLYHHLILFNEDNSMTTFLSYSVSNFSSSLYSDFGIDAIVFVGDISLGNLYDGWQEILSCSTHS